MVQISKKPLPAELFSKLFLLFFQTVGQKKNKKEFELVTKDLFTKAEQIMFMKRIAVLYLLLQGKPQRSISHVLRVSLSTVSKFSLLVEKSTGIVPYLKTILNRKQIAEVFEDILLFLYPPTAYGTESPGKRAIKYEIQKKRRQGI